MGSGVVGSGLPTQVGLAISAASENVAIGLRGRTPSPARSLLVGRELTGEGGVGSAAKGIPRVSVSNSERDACAFLAGEKSVQIIPASPTEELQSTSNGLTLLTYRRRKVGLQRRDETDGALSSSGQLKGLLGPKPEKSQRAQETLWSSEEQQMAPERPIETGEAGEGSFLATRQFLRGSPSRRMAGLAMEEWAQQTRQGEDRSLGPLVLFGQERRDPTSNLNLFGSDSGSDGEKIAETAGLEDLGADKISLSWVVDNCLKFCPKVGVSDEGKKEDLEALFTAIEASRRQYDLELGGVSACVPAIKGLKEIEENERVALVDHEA